MLSHRIFHALLNFSCTNQLRVHSLVIHSNMRSRIRPQALSGKIGILHHLLNRRMFLVNAVNTNTKPRIGIRIFVSDFHYKTIA